MEVADDQPMRAGADDHRVRRGQGLQARRNIGRIADRGHALECFAASYITGYHEPGVDSDAGMQSDPMIPLQPRAQLHYRFTNAKASPHGALRLIFVGARKTEIDQDAVAEVARDE